LLDLGRYFVRIQINFEELNKEMTLEADLKFLLKSKLPLDKLINILPDCKIKIAGNPTSCFLLHFVNSITAYSRNKEASVESRKARYHVYELLWMDGLIVTKRYSKRVALLEEPIDLNDRSSYKTIYESDDVVKNIVLYNDYENFKFYIADENKILKEGELVSRPSEVNKKEIIKGKYLIFRFITS
jgi:hypothetical protein